MAVIFVAAAAVTASVSKLAAIVHDPSALLLPPAAVHSIAISAITSAADVHDPSASGLPPSSVHAFAVAAATQYDPRDVIAADLRGGNAHDHPVVRTHPETGRKCLYVNPGFTARLVGFSEAESAAILEFLYAHGTRPEFIYRHRWSARDLVIWDNRCLMHYAVADYEGLGDRHMHRTTVIGDRPQ